MQTLAAPQHHQQQFLWPPADIIDDDMIQGPRRHASQSEEIAHERVVRIGGKSGRHVLLTSLSLQPWD